MELQRKMLIEAIQGKKQVRMSLNGYTDEQFVLFCPYAIITEEFPARPNEPVPEVYGQIVSHPEPKLNLSLHCFDLKRIKSMNEESTFFLRPNDWERTLILTIPNKVVLDK